jgi:putative toxin-antitoxin system antitoxin component (TIGR02293 family)
VPSITNLDKDEETSDKCRHKNDRTYIMADTAATTSPDIGMDRIVDLLGGKSAFDHPFSTALEAHENIQLGFPAKSLMIFLNQFPTIGRVDTIDKVVGVSLRTLQRQKKAGAKQRLNREQSGKLYKAAEIVAKAVDVLGSPQAAERFLDEPVMALDGKRPIDLLSTPAGAELVEKHLVRLDYGVYT